MERKFLKINDKQEWQDLFKKVLFKTFFHSWEWEEFLESQFPWLRFERYNYQNQALLSLARTKKKLVSHPFCEYGGALPLVPEIDGPAFQEALLDEFKTPFKISFHPYLLKYFKGFDASQSPRETYLLEQIQSLNPDKIGDRNCRRDIMTALENGLTVEKCKTENDLEIFYDFYVKRLKKYRTLVYPFSFFENFLHNHDAEVLLVKKGEKTVGGNIFLFYNRIVHSFLCGFDERYRKLGIHSLVISSAIKKGRKDGFETFDLGATRKSSSLSDFKSRWGAKAYPVFELKNYSGDSRLRNSKLRILFGLLPPLLIKKISPRLLKWKL